LREDEWLISTILLEINQLGWHSSEEPSDGCSEGRQWSRR